GGYRGGSRGGGGAQRGRGGGGGGYPQRPNVPDVRTLAEEVSRLTIGGAAGGDAKTKTAAEGPKRGTAGTDIALIVNHYRITGWEKMSCFLYDIDIQLRRRDGKGLILMTQAPAGAAGGQPVRRLRNEQRADNTRVVAKMADEWPEVFKGRLYAFDGQKFLYAGQRLPVVSELQTKREVTIQLDGFVEQTFEVRIQFVKEVPMAPLAEYFNGRNRTQNPEDFREALQALEIAFRYMPSLTRVPVYRNLYTLEGREPITRGFRPAVATNAEIAFGHYQSVHVTESGLTLNVDRTATLFVTGGPLIAFIERELNIPDIARQPFTDDVIHRVTAKIKVITLYTFAGLKIYTDHIPNQKRRYFIESMIVQRVHEHSFDDSNGNPITVEDYFKKQYPNTRALLRNVGLIKARGEKYLPVDVCHVYPNQPMPRRMVTPDMTQQIVKSANSQDPSTRFGLIQQSAEEVEKESRALMASFGVELQLKPIKLTGRVLPAPRLEGDQRRVKNGRQLSRYAVVNYSVNVKDTLQENYKRFFPELIRTGRLMGIVVADKAIADSESHRPSLKAVDDDIKAFKAQKVEMIFFVIPKDGRVYRAIKHFGDVVYGVATQCILDSRFLDTPNGYFGNLLLKVNAKIGGQNQVLAALHRPPAMIGDQKRAVMVVGVDVTHPGPGPMGDGPVCSSIAASVASFDAEFSKYGATIAGQPLNTEIIAAYDRMFVQHLKTYKEKNKVLPQTVILFRDGVSDGQLDQVLAEEIPLIKKAYDTMQKGFAFKLIVFVVQKRHHTRFMPFARTTDAKGREVRNIPAGTVVDHTVTHPLRNEFHLCSHKGLLGTSRHAKYVCLRDDHQLTEDQRQQIAYHMCYTYCRCTSPISIPMPVAYADLVATRAKDHIEAQNLAFQPRVKDETADQKRARESANIALLNGKVVVHENVVLLPYYA
ncbi:unnamed protein product, partial [Medioppia subpectinata]